MIDTITDAVTSLTAEPETALASGFTPVVFTATVKNSNGQPVANSHVHFTNTGGTLNHTETTTNATGKATVSLTSSNICYITVTAKLSNNPTDAGKSATVAFTADAATATVNSLTANPDIAPADNRTPIIFTAIVKDSYGHLVSDLSVSFTTNGGTLSQKTVTTNASGQASVRLTSASMGDIIVTAKTSIDDTGKSATVTFIDNKATATVTSLDVEPKTIVADPPWKTTFTATVKNSGGYPVSDVDVTFTTTHGTLNPIQTKTNEKGQACTILLVDTALPNGVQSKVTVTAKVTNNAEDGGHSTTATFFIPV
ncbi:Ig-like domain-containing protein [Pectobacterium brasiliense]|uniref:Ig-like domain-containing protein n=1 Tax=Pectobacterium brasiliense TaxID=180957 RepID=UPI00196942CF|nr:Ig-like domain-containing protein [Pectobacterium brasiliense]MBN3265445.1 Ig-like domain-containing protein [Pectobacterium brasiliense]